jgi:putative ATP-dependent endonuclease of the OLD family
VLIRYLSIEHFRGIDALEWFPHDGINCLLGPGDARKTTVLNAVAMLLDPRPPGQASEFDYYLRRLESGFRITAVIAGIEEAMAGQRVPPLRGWKDGKLRAIPDDGAEAVIVAKVTGTPELEINHTLESADGSAVMFSSLLRQQLLLARVATSDRASSELRLARGSMLERAVGGPGLRIWSGLARISPTATNPSARRIPNKS